MIHVGMDHRIVQVIFKVGIPIAVIVGMTIGWISGIQISGSFPSIRYSVMIGIDGPNA
jgi:hypothetical protein